MINKPEYYLERMKSPLTQPNEEDGWLKMYTDDRLALDWMIATGVYDDFERNWIAAEKNPDHGDFILISKAKWNSLKREGTMYVFTCTLQESDSGIMTFVVPDYWEHEAEVNGLILSLAESIKGKIVNKHPKRFIDE